MKRAKRDWDEDFDRRLATFAQRTWPHAVLWPVCALMLVPIVWLIFAAFKNETDFFEYAFLPLREEGEGGWIAWERLTWRNMGALFGEAGIGRAMLNSLFLSGTVAALAGLGAAAGGYALARLRFRGSGLMTGVVLAVLIVPAPLLLAPLYEQMFQLGLLDSYLSLILPQMAPAFGVFLFRQATLQSVPRELIEAARIDGMSEIGAFVNVALPLLRPMMGAFMMIMFLATWNNFIGPQVFLQSPEKMPLAVAVAKLQGLYYQDYGLQMAGTLVSILPVMLLFLLLQRDFIRGLTSGAVKG